MTTIAGGTLSTGTTVMFTVVNKAAYDIIKPTLESLRITSLSSPINLSVAGVTFTGKQLASYKAEGNFEDTTQPVRVRLYFK